MPLIHSLVDSSTELASCVPSGFENAKVATKSSTLNFPLGEHWSEELIKLPVVTLQPQARDMVLAISCRMASEAFGES